MDVVGIIILCLGIMLSPAIIMTIIGFAVRKRNKKAAKILFIMASVYSIIGLGICGALLNS